MRTRLITSGVMSSLHVYYKKRTSKKCYMKLPDHAGGGLRTESTINNTYDFNVGRRLKNLETLRDFGRAANPTGPRR